MTESEQLAHFTVELNALTERFQNEYTISYQAMLGAIEVHKAILMEELLGLSYEVEDEDDTKPAL